MSSYYGLLKFKSSNDYNLVSFKVIWISYSYNISYHLYNISDPEYNIPDPVYNISNPVYNVPDSVYKNHVPVYDILDPK